MSWRLVAEVVAFLKTPEAAPLKPADRAVLLLVAQRAPDDSREAWQRQGDVDDVRRWDLGELSGLGERGLRHALERIADTGFELRVAIGKDGRGKVMYARRGVQTTFRLPELGGLTVPPNDLGGHTSPANDELGGLTSPVGGHTGPPQGSKDRYKDQRVQETEPPRFTEAEPGETCPKHPFGTDNPCGPCGTARRNHDRWERRRDDAEVARTEWLRTCARCPRHAGEYAHACRWCRDEQQARRSA